MHFVGRLVYADAAAAESALHEVEVPGGRENRDWESVVRREDLRRDGAALAIDKHIYAPAMLWDPSVAYLGDLADRAEHGWVLCAFAGDDIEHSIEILQPGDHLDGVEPAPAPISVRGELEFADRDALEQGVRAQSPRASIEPAPPPAPLTQAIVGTRVLLRGEGRGLRREVGEVIHAIVALAAHARAGEVVIEHLHDYVPGGERATVAAGGAVVTVLREA